VRLLHAGHGDVGIDLLSNRTPTLRAAVIRDWLEGNICRCTGYHNIVKAILAAARDAADEGR
jgi:carbon-monoxide dehydrogenase small subunit